MTDLDDLAEIAAQLVARVRDEGTSDNARWLAAVLPDPADWFRLAFTLACAVPAEKPWLALTRWASPDSPELIAERRRQLVVALNAERRTRQGGALTSTGSIDQLGATEAA